MPNIERKDYLLFIEDDKFLQEDLTYFLTSEFTELDCVTISNVSEFITRLDEFRSHPPVAIILDIMMPIGDAQVKYPDIGYTELDGGLICLKLLQQHESIARVPVIVVSAKSQSIMKVKIGGYNQIVSYIAKPINKKAIEGIFDAVCSALALVERSHSRKERPIKKVLSAIEAKPGAFGVKVDLKKLLSRKKHS